MWRIPSLLEEDEDLWPAVTSAFSTGLSISEDDKKIYVEATVPGLDPKDVDVTFEKGFLWIKGEAKDEEEGKKFYRKRQQSFSYRVAVPGEIDQNIEPTASCKNGVMTVTFAKSPKMQPKKISVKSE